MESYTWEGGFGNEWDAGVRVDYLQYLLLIPKEGIGHGYAFQQASSIGKSVA